MQTVSRSRVLANRLQTATNNNVSALQCNCKPVRSQLQAAICSAEMLLFVAVCRECRSPASGGAVCKPRERFPEYGCAARGLSDKRVSV